MGFPWESLLAAGGSCTERAHGAAELARHAPVDLARPAIASTAAVVRAGIISRNATWDARAAPDARWNEPAMHFRRRHRPSTSPPIDGKVAQLADVQGQNHLRGSQPRARTIVPPGCACISPKANRSERQEIRWLRNIEPLRSSVRASEAFINHSKSWMQSEQGGRTTRML